MSMKSVDCLVIGAGISGLLAAQRLQTLGYNVAVVDKGRGVGGRLASRRGENGQRWDHGAQYITATSAAFKTLLRESLSGGANRLWFQQLKDLSGKTLGGPKDRICGKNGMTDWPKQLAQGLNVYTSRRVTRFDTTCDGWDVWCEALAADAEPINFQAKGIIITAPIPQSLKLFDDSQIPVDKQQRDRLEQVIYNPCITFLLQVRAEDGKSPLPEPGGFKITENEEPLNWVADNYVKGISDKPGTLTLHCGPDFSAEHLDDPLEALFPQVLEALQEYTGKLDIESWQGQKWRYAFPANPVFKTTLRLKGMPPCFLAGEGFGGPGKVETAALSGLEAAKQLNDLLQSENATSTDCLDSAAMLSVN